MFYHLYCRYAVILAFDVKVERDAQELADSLGVRIFSADIIYHLFDQFMAYRDEIKKKKQEEFKHVAVFPCKLRILPQFIFNTRDPIVVGVVIEAGFIKVGTPLCVPSKEVSILGSNVMGTDDVISDELVPKYPGQNSKNDSCSLCLLMRSVCQ